jgi:alkylation response protein AidB-like acyl-CoA dehydrogenase
MPPATDGERLALREMVHGFLAEHSASGSIRRVMATESGFDPDLWRAMAELGLPGLAIPESHGGAGCSAIEVGIVMSELGAAMTPAPYLSTSVLAPAALLESADHAAQEKYLPLIAEGTLISALAVTEDSGQWTAGDCATTARPHSSGSYRLDGRKRFVLDGQIASLLLVVAATGQGPSLFAVDAAAAGITRTPIVTLDATRRLADVRFESAPAELLGTPGAAATVLATVVTHALVALAAECAGGASHCLAMSVQYAKRREQFGRPIASFQAIKHKCADMMVLAEAGRSAAQYAGSLLASGDPSSGQAAVAAFIYCSDAYVTVATETIQIHGGIGFTWEHDAHLYLKRAKSSQLLLGDTDTLLMQLASMIGV